MTLQFKFYLVSTQVVDNYNGAPYSGTDILITKFKGGLDYIVRASSYANAVTLVSHRIYTENSQWLAKNPNGIPSVEFPVLDHGSRSTIKSPSGDSTYNPVEGCDTPQDAIQQVEDWARNWVHYIDQEDIKVSESRAGFPLKDSWHSYRI